MKLSSKLCLSIVVLAALVTAVDGAFASINLNSSRSNVYRISKDQNAAKTCITGGGTVSTDKDGNKICTMPAGLAVGDEGIPSPSKPKNK